jgi:hypothetical protein
LTSPIAARGRACYHFVVIPFGNCQVVTNWRQVAIAMAAPNADMAQFFDFGEAAMPDAAHEQVDHDAFAIQTSER